MAPMDTNEKSQLGLLEGRFAEGVGFPHRPGGGFRPDATAWAILALEAAGSTSGVIDKARRLLANAQGQDGRVCVSPQHPDACWPTPLAALAWHGAPQYDEPRTKAVRFLLEFDQLGVLDGPQTGESHDVTIRGWPWIAKTHPWVEPTAYVLLALRVCGGGSHSRRQDAVRLLMDRQLADGGWNVGTTVTFGKQMWPTPEATGLGLQALAGLVPKTGRPEQYRVPAVATAGPERPDVPRLGDSGASCVAGDSWTSRTSESSRSWPDRRSSGHMTPSP